MIRAMIMGLNQGVRHGGLPFHVQTEHRPAKAHEQIVTHVFYKGVVVAGLETRHEKVVGTAAEGRRHLRRVLRKQHAQVLRDLARGVMDARIASLPGTAEFRAAVASSGKLSAERLKQKQVEQHLVRGIELCCQALEEWDEALRIASGRRDLEQASETLADLIQQLKTAAAPQPAAGRSTGPANEFDEETTTPVGLPTAQMYEVLRSEPADGVPARPQDC